MTDTSAAVGGGLGDRAGAATTRSPTSFPGARLNLIGCDEEYLIDFELRCTASCLAIHTTDGSSALGCHNKYGRDKREAFDPLGKVGHRFETNDERDRLLKVAVVEGANLW